jgi:hypothetical protein
VFIVFGSTSPPFLHTDTTLQGQTLLTLIEKQKWVMFPSLFQSSNSNYFNHLFAFFLDKIDFYRFVDVINVIRTKASSRPQIFRWNDYIFIYYSYCKS